MFVIEQIREHFVFTHFSWRKHKLLKKQVLSLSGHLPSIHIALHVPCGHSSLLLPTAVH